MDVAAEEAIVVVNKGKRTKRQRPCSPASAMNLLSANNNSNNNNNVCEYLSSSSWSSGEEGEDHDHDPRCFPSPVATKASTDSTEEEEDMANCLILLAQGTQGCPRRRIIDDDYRINPSKRLNIGVGDDDGMVNNCNNKLGNRKVVGGGGGGEGKNNNGFYLYKCKTCNRCFPSFQALGGHRASHKKPRTSPVAVAVVEDKKSLLLDEDRRENQFTNRNLSTTTTTTTTTTIPSLGLALHLGNRISSPNNNNNNNNKAKVHECSVCGSEFSSGQALGGHMRRHRPSIAATGNNGSNVDSITSESDQEVRIKKERNVLTLDLNLPAPEDDKFSFNSKQVQQQQQPPPLVFSAPALVDCHY